MTITTIVRFVVVLAILAVLGVTGAHWYLQNKVESGLDEIVNGLYPVAVISYEDAYSSILDSSIGAENLTIRPRAVRDEIKIERVIFQAPNIKFLMDAEEELKNGDIPETMRISVTGFTINTDGGIAKSIDKYSSSPSLGARDKSYGCADVKQFGFAELRNMGYKQISLDLDLSYAYSPTANKLRITSSWSSRMMFGLETTGIFEVKNSQFKLDQIDQLFNQISNIQITYRDLGFNQSTIRYCNRHRKDHNYVAAHIEAFKQDLQNKLGLVPSKPLIDAYRTFMLGSGVINISSNLRRPMNPEYFSLYSPRDVILLLRPDITVNGQSVDIPYADLLKDTPDKPDKEKPAVDSSIEKKTVSIPGPETEPKPEPSGQKEFAATELSMLKQHIGNMVRVTTKQGTIRTGSLIEASSSKILIEVSLRGGSMTYPMYKNNIVKVEISN